MEPKIGEIISIDGVKYITKLYTADKPCSECAFQHKTCWNLTCNVLSRKDYKQVIFKQIEETMNEVKIQIPDNCKLIKDGNTYIVKEKKQAPPRSWEEFCKKYPLRHGESYIDPNSEINVVNYKCKRNVSEGKNWCTSKEEAKAFLALMQLRQLRKAWVGDWEITDQSYYCIFPSKTGIKVVSHCNVLRSLSFPTRDMANDFLNCFRDLCEIAKPLL